MNWFTLIFKYLGAALQILSVVQTVLPTAPGPVKKAVAVAMLKPADAEKADVGAFVDTLVGALVESGAWQKDKAPVAGLVTSA
jgi:hypothetical protein